MSTTYQTFCDKCGVKKPEPPDRNWWDFQYTSMDTRVGNNYEFKSGSWDLCPDCALIAYTALVQIAGNPRPESDALA